MCASTCLNDFNDSYEMDRGRGAGITLISSFSRWYGAFLRYMSPIERTGVLAVPLSRSRYHFLDDRYQHSLQVPMFVSSLIRKIRAGLLRLFSSVGSPLTG